MDTKVFDVNLENIDAEKLMQMDERMLGFCKFGSDMKYLDKMKTEGFMYYAFKCIGITLVSQDKIKVSVKFLSNDIANNLISNIDNIKLVPIIVNNMVERYMMEVK